MRYLAIILCLVGFASAQRYSVWPSWPTKSRYGLTFTGFDKGNDSLLPFLDEKWKCSDHSQPCFPLLLSGAAGFSKYGKMKGLPGYGQIACDSDGLFLRCVNWQGLEKSLLIQLPPGVVEGGVGRDGGPLCKPVACKGEHCTVDEACNVWIFQENTDQRIKPVESDDVFQFRPTSEWHIWIAPDFWNWGRRRASHDPLF